MSVGQFIAGYSDCIRQIQKFALSRIGDSSAPSFANDVQEKLTEYLLSYLKSFSDDATRSLQNRNNNNHSNLRSLNCPSPPTGNIGGCSSSDVSGDCSPPSRQSTLSSFASPEPIDRSPSRDSNDDSDDNNIVNRNRNFLIFSSSTTTHASGDRLDLNNNAHSQNNMFSDVNLEHNNHGNHVWRPWQNL